ncbi:YihY/virulence factor BrkB family protein [Companilactobacillus sp.]|jgi:membrane protein|uniref:YihY/virulence factor BrkB family protein n=2 Tax=Companilactobacillus sp. TaxID=2767905 RepID=UPI0025BF3892|nr:YihY/virulence factor BrkB family protein [Companilactobacillus sp.]MCH4008897.1 YihY/virulence factor BrkB family protein [Companilactobacillus sp.]MCH4050924.1 YihY/virulence factor BrkB family protein [Companilactobacillus sp.]MCH4076840.1 YihY/virulence factor BrkB family protein [Companilactobacillus sp.]MCH4125415.1 YihY/virulence factor BrkB family protein [Companilactobacillus sp.]MCH4131957.1 YihY/virulence factor BrkB family protein [Companilactobacillus sp.]
MAENEQQTTPIFRQDISNWQKMLGFFKEVGTALGNSNVTMASKAITYYILLALFPAVIIVGNLIPLLHLNRPTVIEYIEFMLPTDLHDYMMPTIIKVLSDSNKGILSVGIVLAIWAISRGTNIAQMTMNQAYGFDVNSLYADTTFFNFLIRRSLAFVMTFVMLVAGVAVVSIFTFGQAILKWLLPTIGLDIGFLTEFSRWKWPIAIVIMLLVVFTLFYFLPNVRLKIHYVLLGTVVTSIGVLLLSQLFSYYLDYFGTAWNNYGTIGAIIIFLLWMNLTVIIFLFGNAVNVGFAEASQGPFLHEKTSKLTNILKSHEKEEE